MRLLSQPISDPLAIVAVLLTIEGVVLLLADWRRTRKFFNYVPSMFWIYSLPMVANTLGIIPDTSAVYDVVSKYFLPACLVLLLLSVDAMGILHLGPRALTVMLAGSVGILLGGPLMLLIFKRWLPADAWMGIGALSASWIGGSANMLAVKAANKVPDKIFSPMVVVDTICPYAWMTILVLLSAYQKKIDKFFRADVSMIDGLSRRYESQQRQSHPIELRHVVVMFMLPALVTWGCIVLSDHLPKQGSSVNFYRFISAGGWAIIFATTAGLLLSFTPAKRLESYGASRFGYAMLYFVLTTIGAKTSLASLASAPILIVLGFAWIAFHALVTLGVGVILRTPVSIMAAASQANIGGPASAPVVARTYQPGLASVGLLMAVLGNILGTYMGLLCSELCRMVK
jgi:uncharacterized membrane protein